MRNLGTVCLIAACVVSLSACGGKKEAEQAKKAAEEAQKTAEQAASAVEKPASPEDFAKGMAQLGQAMQGLQKSPDGKDYTPVSFRGLVPLLPEISGWEREEPSGESMTSPVKYSEAKASYTKGDSRMEVKIVDTAMSAMLTLPYQMLMATGYEKESSSGFEKATTFGGNPGWLKWDNGPRRAEGGVIVGKRFMVNVEANDVEDAKIVEEVISKIDVGKLGGLK
jgi:hypothetical protein